MAHVPDYRKDPVDLEIDDKPRRMDSRAPSCEPTPDGIPETQEAPATTKERTAASKNAASVANKSDAAAPLLREFIKAKAAAPEEAVSYASATSLFIRLHAAAAAAADVQESSQASQQTTGESSVQQHSYTSPTETPFVQQQHYTTSDPPVPITFQPPYPTFQPSSQQYQHPAPPSIESAILAHRLMPWLPPGPFVVCLRTEPGYPPYTNAQRWGIHIEVAKSRPPGDRFYILLPDEYDRMNPDLMRNFPPPREQEGEKLVGLGLGIGGSRAL